MFSFLKKYKITLIVITLLVAGYYAFVTFGAPSVPGDLLTSQSASVDGTAAGQEIISILNDIKSIKLNTGIFEDEKFNSLVDLTDEVIGEPQGRRNPFEQIGFGIDVEGRVAEPSTLTEDIGIENSILPE